MRLAYIFGLLLFLSAVCPAADRTLSQTVDVTTARVQPAALGFFRGESVSYTVTPRLGPTAISVSTNATATWTLCVQTNVNLAVLDTTAVSISSNGVCVFYSPIASNTMAAGTYDSFVRVQDGATLVTASRTTFNVYKSPYSEAVTVLPFSLAEPLWVAASNRVVYSNSTLFYPMNSNPSNYVTTSIADDTSWRGRTNDWNTVSNKADSTALAAYVSTSGVTSIIYTSPAAFQVAGTYLVPGDTNSWTVTGHGGLVETNDSRLTDSRTPLAHSQDLASITDFVASAYASSNQGAKADGSAQTNEYNVFASSNKFVGTIHAGTINVSDIAIDSILQLGTNANSAIDAGSGATMWRDGESQRVFDFGNARQLYDATGSNSINIALRYLETATGSTTVEWGSRLLLASDRTTLDWQNSSLYGTNNGISVMDWGIRRLLSNDGLWRAQGTATAGEEIVNFQTMAGMGYLTNLTASSIAAAGGLTNVWNDPYMLSSNLLGNVVSGTCTVTRTMGNALRIEPTNTVYFTADSTMTDSNAAVGFTLDIFYNASTFGFVNAVVSNAATLTSNSWNSIIFWKGYGSTQFIGK